MPTLILPPRLTPGTDAIYTAALAAGWDAVRLTSWRIPPGLSQRDPVLYGEPLFADVVAGALGVALLQAPFDWLPTLSARYRSRDWHALRLTSRATTWVRRSSSRPTTSALRHGCMNVAQSCRIRPSSRTRHRC